MKEIVEHKQRKKLEQPILLKDCKINIIFAQKAVLRLPKPQPKKGHLKIIFMDIGTFYIEGNGNLIKLGQYEDKWVMTHPGQGPYDSQPEFMWIKKRKIWICLTQGCLEFPKKDEITSIHDKIEPIQQTSLQN